ncbi:MAG: hypothetical protein H7122_03725 [Chitinophagaceae bacterium]|nr:hypothetical protein [Chitinophagaceae bacterium]
MMKTFLFFLLAVFIHSIAFPQQTDSIKIKNDSSVIKDTVGKEVMKIDTLAKKKFIPRKATLRSAIIPGWGQIYNKKYWKLPLVYAAVGIPVYAFVYNRGWYTKTRDAAKMIANNDTIDWRNRVDPKLHVFFPTQAALGSLLNYRNEYRRDMDYSILFVLLAWGLNVVDATVDAHLKGFDISDDLSLKIKPTILSGTSTAGISLVFTIGKNNSYRKIKHRWQVFLN